MYVHKYKSADVYTIFVLISSPPNNSQQQNCLTNFQE